jgi:diguanylate cyclase (GGDEF)-like protein/hemerythrin-like metal-binding protein
MSGLALGFTFNLLRGQPALLLPATFLNNLFFTLGMVSLHIGTLRFFGAKEHRTRHVIFVVAFALFIAYATWENNQLELRRIGISATVAWLSFSIARAVLVLRNGPARTAELILIFAFSLNGLLFCLRAMFPLFGEESHHLAILLAQELTYLVAFIATTLWTYGFILLVNQRLHGQNAEARAQLEHLSQTDGLTGVANRRRFDEILALEYQRHSRSRGTLSLLMLDVDHFKAFNDHYGHLQGDACLRQIASVLSGCTGRPSDLAARYGGEEFAGILSETSHSGALLVAERIRKGVEQLAIPHQGANTFGHITVSIGVITLHCSPAGNPLELVAWADELLYRAKRGGRNLVIGEAPSLNALRPGEAAPERMVRLAWREAYSSGHPMIDAQHKELLAEANELLDAMLSSRPTAEIQPTLLRLAAHIKTHFSEEISLLKERRYPQVDSHAEEHERLLARAKELIAAFQEARLSIGEMFQFLVQEVVIQHMNGMDRDYFYLTREVSAAPSPDSHA